MDVGPSEVGPSIEAGNGPPNTLRLPATGSLPDPTRPA